MAKRSHWLLAVAAALGLALGLTVLVLTLTRPLPNHAHAKLQALDALWTAYQAGDVPQTAAITRLQNWGVEKPGFAEHQIRNEEDDLVGYAALRRTALSRLGQIDAPQATDALLAVMDRPRLSVFVAVMDALAQRRDPRSLEPLAHQLQRELQRLPYSDEIDGPARINAVARAISALSSPAALAVLRRALADAADPIAAVRLRFAVSVLENQLNDPATPGLDSDGLDPATSLPRSLLNRLPADKP